MSNPDISEQVEVVEWFSRFLEKNFRPLNFRFIEQERNYYKNRVAEIVNELGPLIDMAKTSLGGIKMKSCNCKGWQEAVENRGSYQKHGGLFVGFMMADPEITNRPHMQYEGAGEVVYCPWCGGKLVEKSKPLCEAETSLKDWLKVMEYESIEDIYHDLTYRELLGMMEVARKYFKEGGE